MGKAIITLITDDKRIFKIGELDTHRIVRSITLRTTPIAGAFIDGHVYVIAMERDDKQIHYGIVPMKNVAYLEFMEIKEEKKEKPLELHAAAQAEEPDGQA